jgi:hypothetical protein
MIPPTDIDLKAAYCIRLTQLTLADLSARSKTMVDAAVSESQRRDVQNDLDSMVRESSDQLNRLQTYLIPRLKYVDATGLMGASKRAEIDMQQYGQMAKACANCTLGDGWGKCMTDGFRTCMAGELQTRIQQCASLTWLPF